MATDCRIVLTYRQHDQAKNTWSDMIEVDHVEGRKALIEIPRNMGAQAGVGELLKKGADLPGGAAKWAGALETARALQVPNRIMPARCGWQGGDGAFVSSTFVAANTDGCLLPRDTAAGRDGKVGIVGSLDDWKALAKYACRSTAMTVALCAVFAAPLLRALHRPSFGIVFYGKSRIGKSMSQLLAASAMGYGVEEDMPNLNATTSGLIAAAPDYNDQMFPINEVATASGGQSDVHQAIRSATYKLIAGQDVLRHPSWTAATGGAAPSFQTIILMSSEVSPDIWAERGGATRDDGERARMIGMAVDRRGWGHIYDRPPRKFKGKKRAEWVARVNGKLRAGLPHARGAAFKIYVERLAENRQQAQLDALHLLESFEADFALRANSNVARDVVAKFGALFAGGVLASRFQIFPASEAGIRARITSACQSALDDLPDPAEENREDRTLLREKLGSGPILDLSEPNKKLVTLLSQADGYKERSKAGERYRVRATVFESWFKTPARAKAMLQWLDSEGYLITAKSASRGQSNNWAQTQGNWPDGSRPRSFEIRFPKDLSVLR